MKNLKARYLKTIPDPSRPPGESVRAAGRVAMVALLGVVGCASPVLLTPERVEQIPPGRYDVLAAHRLGGGLDYAAVLFQTWEENHVALAMPGVERRSAAGPAEFVNGRAAGFSAYELRDAANAVRGYLLLPPRSSVRVWDRAAQHELVIMVDSLDGAYQGGGGGGGTGGGAGSGM
ncbi:MAG TPA: hypothetical protein VN323_08870 [Candidatus Dormibacteraeota bacterium]|jgi:hypothetical protein|nr:hypothetical protein [Candidatus Dormibacteraeota bacterium]